MGLRLSRRRRCSAYVAGLVLAMTASCTGSDEPKRATTHECEKLRDHVVDMRVAGTQADIEEHRAAIKGALGTAFVEECTKKLMSSDVTCALKAADSQQATECTRAWTTSSAEQGEKQ